MPTAQTKTKAPTLPMIGGQIVQPWLGPVAMPGIYSGMPIEKYHSREAAIEPSVSSGILRTISSKSPAHYWVDSYYNDHRIVDEDEEESEALVFGRAAHHWLFGFKNEFHGEFVVEPEMWPDPKTGEAKPWSRKREVCREWIKQQDRSVLRRSHIDTIDGMLLSLHSNHYVDQGIFRGKKEYSWFFKHGQTGLWVKVRPDVSPTESLDFVDLKTCHSADWQSMQRAIFDNGYFIQAGLVAMAAKAICREPMNSFTLVFVEKKPPYDISIMQLKDNDIDLGVLAAEKALATFAQCYKTQQWPGRYPEQKYIEMTEGQRAAVKARL